MPVKSTAKTTLAFKVFSTNHKIMETKANYLGLIWITQEQGPILLGDMKRSHVQNTLNWCIRKGAGPNDEKDGILYRDWIMYFTARLFDPELK